MLFALVFATLLSPALTLSTSPPPSIDIDLSGDPSSNTIAPLVVSNNSLTLNGTYPQEQYDIYPSAINAAVQCDGERYGVDLDRDACYNAMSKIGNETEFFTVAQRGLARRPKMVLPNRYVSSNGRCVIDLITLPNIRFPDTISNHAITTAALKILTSCISPTVNRGGSIGDLGINHNLAVIIRRYSVLYICSDGYGNAPTIGSCAKVISTVPVGTDVRTFGEKTIEGVQEPTPKHFRGTYTKCVVTVDTFPSSAKGTWFDIWAGAVAIDTLCVDEGSAGIAYRIGESGNDDIRVVLREVGSGGVVVDE